MHADQRSKRAEEEVCVCCVIAVREEDCGDQGERFEM